ncbi:MAG: plastocyanin/azurin family copper-binding protein [Gammaproteobacteria bacterium]
MSKFTFGALSACVLLISTAASAEEHIVQGVVTQWKPLVTFAQPGDTLRFTGMTGHDTETIEGMFPEGGTAWKSQLGQEGFSVTLDAEGMWVYKCNPHITTGMVGVVVVGDARPPANMAALEEALPDVKVGRNMVNRALKKARKAMEAEGS